MAGPLSHIKVLDLSRVLAAPWAAQNLADLGAEVIKVERPVKGDDSRSYAPPFLKDEHGKETRESAYFCAANRGKKSITINISKPEGQQLVRELAKEEHGVLLASHLLYEVEQICDRVLVINKGKLIASGTIAEITAGAGTIEVAVSDPARAAAILRGLPGIADVQEMEAGVKVTAEPARGADVNRALAAAGIYASAIVPHKSSLEDVFLEITEDGGAGAPAAS